MATLDRIEPAYQPWSPSATGLGIDGAEGARDELYSGRHRRPGRRMLSLGRLFYGARHRRH